MIPSGCGLLRAVVKVDAEAGEIFSGGSHATTRREAVLLTEGVATEKRVAVGKIVIDSNGALILEMTLVANVEVVVGVGAAAGHHHVRHWDILHQESFEDGIDTAGRDDVSRKLRASVGEIRGTGWFGRIVSGILDGGGGVVDLEAAHAEVALNFLGSWHGENLGIGLG